MATPAPADGSDAVVVDGSLLADLLHSVATTLHDRPVQSLVAGRLLVETGIGVGPHGEVIARGLGAIAAAAEQTRDLMWALDGVSLRPGHLAVDIADAVARGGFSGGAVEVVVALDHDPDEGYAHAVGVLLQAVHELLVGVLLAGGHAVRLAVKGDAEALHATLVSAPTGAGSDTGPWARLARARLAAAGGDVATAIEGDARVARLSLPLPETAQGR